MSFSFTKNVSDIFVRLEKLGFFPVIGTPESYVLYITVALFLIVVVPELLVRRANSASDKGSDVSRGLKREQARSSNMGGTAKDDRLLNPIYFKPFTVIETTKVSHNTILLRFEIPNDRDLGLAVGRHVSVKAELDGSRVIRPYTPTSRPDTKGYFELMVKRYLDGKMSSYMWNLQVGDTLDIRGPVGCFKYNKNEHRRIGLIAGGTGLTPCLQVIRCILEGPEGKGDNTEFVLFFQNRTESDVLLREELEVLANTYKRRLRVLFFLSNPQSNDWGNQYSTGKALKSFFSKPSDGTVPELKGYINNIAIKAAMTPLHCGLVGICGPSGFNQVMKDLLIDVGHEAESDSNNNTVFVW